MSMSYLTVVRRLSHVTTRRLRAVRPCSQRLLSSVRVPPSAVHPSAVSRAYVSRCNAISLAQFTPRCCRPLTSAAGDTVTINFVLADKTVKTATARPGQNLLEVCQDEANKIDDVEGACEGACACSTCHMILPQDLFDSLDEPEEEELDMLDLALHVTPTSRLGCQIEVTPEMDGITIELPEEVADMQ